MVIWVDKEIMINKEIILAYALKNAVEHGGNAKVSSVLNGLFNHGLEKDKIKEIMPELNDVLGEVNAFTNEEQKVLYEKHKSLIGHRVEREGLPELPNSKKGVIMRFAPSPSGPLHVGHILSNMTSSLYVKKYGGKFYVRIEDTNPDSIYVEGYDEIKRDCDWIFGNVFEYIIQSERMEIYYKYVEILMKKNAVYVCDCESEKFKEDFVLKKKNCPCRSLSVKENLERWERMLSKDKNNFKQGEAVLRFKSNMKNKNPALRDFPLARINVTKHPLQNSKYRVWPLMNLSVSVDDIEYKMTHIIRGKDHKDNAERQKLIFKALGKKYPWTFFMGRVKFSDLELSKRKIVKKIQEGEYLGFDDEKLPTISALKKRGYKPEAFEKFVIQRGLSEVDKVISQKDFFLILDNFNKIS